MALRAVVDHPKFARLKALLKQNKSCTLGYLEGMWHFCGRYTPNGNIGKYDLNEIEAWLEWDGEDGALIAAFVKARWIDEHPEHGLIVHDWHQHADSMTHADLAKKTCLFISGHVPKINHESFSGPTRVRIKAEFEFRYGISSGQCLDSVGTMSLGLGSSPMTIPEPEPEPEPEPPVKSAGAQNDSQPAKSEISKPDAKPKPKPWEKFLEIELPEKLATVEFREKWREFCAARAEIKHPLTDLACSGILTKLGKFEPDIGIQALQNSINSGWRDVFPEKILKDRERSNGDGRQKSVFEMAQNLTARVASGN